MYSSSAPGPRPTSPVEEDLQQLYNEVWAVFAEETPQQSSEGDLENIYNGYGDDSDATPAVRSNSNLAQPSQTSAPTARYRPLIETSNPPQSPAKPSPTRRRLPPTPADTTSASSSTYAMPEPEPYYAPSSSQQKAKATYTPSAPYDTLNRNGTFESTSSSSSNGRRLPQEPGASNGYISAFDEKRILGREYLSHNSTNSQASYSSSGSLASYSTKATSVTGEGTSRPPGASAPALPPKPSAFRDDAADPRYQYQPAYKPYDLDNTSGSYSQTYEAAPAAGQRPPPPPSKTGYSSATGSYIGDFALDPIHLSPFSDFDLNKEGSSGQSFANQQSYQASTSANPYISVQPGSSNVAAVSDPRLDDWDPASAYGDPRSSAYIQDDDNETAGPSDITRRPTEMLHSLATYDHEPVDYKEPSQLEEEEGYWEDEDEDDETRFVNFSLLSHIAMQLRDKVPRGTHVKGSIPYPRAFTGKDIVSTIQTQIQRELAINHGVSTSDRRVALQVARSLQSQLFFYEVEWGSRPLQDGVEDVYMFLDDAEGTGSDGMNEREELPTSVITMLTRCYSPSCGEGLPCYSFTCPRKETLLGPLPVVAEAPTAPKEEEWSRMVDPVVLNNLPQAEINRQSIIHKLITREEQYLQDLDLVESVFIKPLRSADPPIMPPNQVEDLIDDIFGNILDLRETNRRLLEVLYVRQREEGPVIQRIGDIFLQAAAEFRYAYPTYIGHYPVSEKRLKEEVENNNAFRLFLEQCARQQTSRSAESPRLDLKHFLNRPSEHLQKYPVLLEAVHHETAEENTDNEFLVEAIEAIRKLQSAAQLRTFQAAMGKGTPGKWEWHDLVPTEIREKYPKKVQKRQQIIFELIKGEMAYVKDLENIKHIYIMPLRKAEPPIIARDRLEDFIDEVFHNYMELFEHHKRLLDKLHEIQRDQHPIINSVTAALFDAALNWREGYMEYIPNYPIAAYRIDDEMANNLAFKTFVDQCVRHPDAHRLDMKNFINRPIPRLLRYELLLKGILEESPEGHEDIETIPNVIDVIKSLGKETEPGVSSAKTKVELWRYNSNLTFKPGEAVDMDLLDKNRQLIHSGKLLRQPESGLEWNGWSELHVLLFDNYLVTTKTKDRDGVTKYQVNRRPVPLDLLSLVNFTDPPTQRSTGLLKPFGSQAANVSPESATDSRYVYPLTLHHNGRTGGTFILYAESAQIRAEWKTKLDEALGLRKAVQESNKAFEIEYLSRDTFIMPSLAAGANGPAWNQDNQFTGKVTCSVPFNTPDGRALVAIGCSEGVWIGFRHDPKSMRRVLLLKMVTQCAMLEEFGIFLVLADKALFAYHIEALVPTPTQAAHASQAMPQKISGTKDVHFFSVGKLQGRTLVVYMKKKAMDSIFRVLEPVGDKINERVKSAAGFGSRLGFRSAKSEWFRVYRDFFLPSDSFDVIFLKARIAILCAKGFEIMNLQDFGSITLPQKEDQKHAQTLKRCENARPIGMFRSSDEEFLLCYDEFGLYVDKHGDPSRAATTIEWEGTAERAAFHSPYVLLFDPRFIEIRHIETGRLMQIISGTEIRCTWDGRGGIPHPNTPMDPADEAQEAQVHFVMNSSDPVAGSRSKNIVQHVCELIPTVPLFPAETPMSASTIGFPPAVRQMNPAAYQDGYSPAPSHQYSNSYASSVQSYPSSTTPTVQTYTPSPVSSQHYPTSAQHVPQGYSPSLAPSQQSYTSPPPQLHYDPRAPPQQGYAPQHPYATSQASVNQPYSNSPGHQPPMHHSQPRQPQQPIPQANVAQYSRGGYSSTLAPAPQHDLRHSSSWRS